jgi:hypothetical protein
MIERKRIRERPDPPPAPPVELPRRKFEDVPLRPGDTMRDEMPAFLRRYPDEK